MINAHPLYDHFHQHLSESAMQMYGEIGNLKLGTIQFKFLKLRREASDWVLITIHPWPAAAAAALLFRWKNVAIIQL